MLKPRPFQLWDARFQLFPVRSGEAAHLGVVVVIHWRFVVFTRDCLFLFFKIVSIVIYGPKLLERLIPLLLPTVGEGYGLIRLRCVGNMHIRCIGRDVNGRIRATILHRIQSLQVVLRGATAISAVHFWQSSFVGCPVDTA